MAIMVAILKYISFLMQSMCADQNINHRNKGNNLIKIRECGSDRPDVGQQSFWNQRHCCIVALLHLSYLLCFNFSHILNSSYSRYTFAPLLSALKNNLVFPQNILETSLTQPQNTKIQTGTLLETPLTVFETLLTLLQMYCRLQSHYGKKRGRKDGRING